MQQDTKDVWKSKGLKDICGVFTESGLLLYEDCLSLRPDPISSVTICNQPEDLLMQQLPFIRTKF